jgi:hypothetical protein
MRYPPITRPITKRTLRFAAAVLASVFPCLLHAQQTSDQETSIVTVRGRVLNQVTKAPISRALVTMVGDEYASITDDHGQFEIKMTQRVVPNQAEGGNLIAISRPGTPLILTARKPGFLPVNRRGGRQWVSANSPDVTIYLVPEALIVGHVEIPNEQGEVRIPCELYRREMSDGREDWQSVDRFTTWLDGEFRFSNLQAGTYKLITNEQMDRNSQIPVPGSQLFGYPPIYYPNTTDFSLATPITVRAGETAQVDLTVARHAYYPVRIAVTNASSGRPINVTVYPSGHPSPGWSLGYNAMEQTIEGMLPDGSYTLEADALGESTGITNFTVRDRPSMSSSVLMVANKPITVNLHEEFKSEENNGAIANPGSADQGISMRAQVILNPLEKMRDFGTQMAMPVPGSQGQIMTLRNLRPGSYMVSVVPMNGNSYAAVIESGGVNLLKQPLVVGLGGGNPPIEITLRDDGGQISGTVHDDTPQENGANTDHRRYLYLLPAEGFAWRLEPGVTWSRNNFYIHQVAPGNYLVIVFDHPQDDLPYGSEDALQPLLNQGKMVHVEAGQNVTVDLPVVGESNPQ